MKNIVVFFMFSLIFLNSNTFAKNVVYNTQTNKYHKTSCYYAKKCKTNCIKISKKQATKNHAHPCKKCSKKWLSSLF